MSTPTQAHRCIAFKITDSDAGAILTLECSCPTEFGSVGFLETVNAFAAHVLAASRGSDEATDALIGELREECRDEGHWQGDAPGVCAIDCLNGRAADALAAFRSKS